MRGATGDFVIGSRFNKALITADLGVVLGKRRVYCLCDCGKPFQSRLNDLRSGNNKSCGCVKRDMVIVKNTTHGRSYTREYRSWGDMIKRCYNSNTCNYEDYGGRGVTVCDRWRHSFENFYADMGDCPVGKSLDKDILVPGNLVYSKEFCIWATRSEQAFARRPRKPKTIS